MKKILLLFLEGLWLFQLTLQASFSGERIYIVNQHSKHASDNGKGTRESPFLTINHAAQIALPGDTILVYSGVYRERICPARGGEPGKPIVYMSASGEKVFLRGSDVFTPRWQKVEGKSGVYFGEFYNGLFGFQVYRGNIDTSLFGDCNPFLVGFNRNITTRPQSKVVRQVKDQLTLLTERSQKREEESERSYRIKQRISILSQELQQLTDSLDPRYRLTLGLVFIDGIPLTETQYFSELYNLPGSWMVSPEGDGLLIHFPMDSDPDHSLVEITTRHTIFSPLVRNLGYITVNGFVIEHAANHYPSWGHENWSQVGALSCRSGHHWVIENNTVRFAKGIGIDCGSENEEDEKIEFPGNLSYLPSTIIKAYEEGTITESSTLPGHHLIRNNLITDNGICGITGIGQIATIITGNIIERNNRSGNTSPLWEFGGIKFHFFFHGLIEGNLIRDNDAHGIWLDNNWRDTRISRNVIVNNLWSGMNIELGRGPLLIDNNVVAYTRQGSGLYGHDVSDVTMAHNLIYANSGFGIWFAYATPRVEPGDGCWDHKILNNLILGNSAGAISLPIPWEMGGNNLSDGNVFMGGGEYLDEGSGPLPVLFQFNNFSHMGKMRSGVPENVEPMTAERLYETMISILNEKNFPDEKRPDSLVFKEHFLVSLDAWRNVLNNDLDSREIRVIRGGLQSRILSWEFDMPETVFNVKCRKVPGVDKDFYNNIIQTDRLIPGPFQDLHSGRIRVILWPMRDIGSH